MYLVNFYLDDITWSTHVMDDPGLDNLGAGRDCVDKTDLDDCGLGQDWPGQLWSWTRLAWTIVALDELGLDKQGWTSFNWTICPRPSDITMITSPFHNPTLRIYYLVAL